MTDPTRFEADPEQARVLSHRRGALLVTGQAGTGKTAVLEERFAGLLEDGADPERVALVGAGRVLPAVPRRAAPRGEGGLRRPGHGGGHRGGPGRTAVRRAPRRRLPGHNPRRRGAAARGTRRVARRGRRPGGARLLVPG